jgi:excisionase family DNA binding protein
VSATDQRRARARIARAVLDELRDDPDALEELRELLDAGPAAYTSRTLAADLEITPRAVRAAIERGDLDAVKSGRGYVISREAVADWATPARKRRREVPRQRRALRDTMAELGD